MTTLTSVGSKASEACVICVPEGLKSVQMES